MPDDLLPHVAPLGWEHIARTGDYVWAEVEAASTFRPLNDVRATGGLGCSFGQIVRRPQGGVFPTAHVDAEAHQELSDRAADLDHGRAGAHRFGTDVDQGETRPGAAWKRLLDPGFAVPELARLDQERRVSVGPLESQLRFRAAEGRPGTRPAAGSPGVREGRRRSRRQTAGCARWWALALPGNRLARALRLALAYLSACSNRPPCQRSCTRSSSCRERSHGRDGEL